MWTSCLEVQNMWLWISCVEVQKHLIEKVFKYLQQPKNSMSGKILCSHKQPENVCCYCCCCIPWLVILVVYLDFSRMKRWIFLNHFENSFFFLKKNECNPLCRREFWENIVFLGKRVWQAKGCKAKPFFSTLKELKSLNPYKHFRLSL